MCMSGLKKNKLAMVDLDDTLLYTLEANHLAYREALQEQGFDLSLADYAAFCNGRSYKDFLPRIMGVDHPAMSQVHRRKTELYASYMAKARLNQPLVDILQAIRPEYHLALVTTASRINVERILEKFGLAELFDLLITREDVSVGKPDPSCYRMAMEHFGLSPEDCMIFEDSPSGIQAAMASGCRTFCIKWEER